MVHTHRQAVDTDVWTTDAGVIIHLHLPLEPLYSKTQATGQQPPPGK